MNINRTPRNLQLLSQIKSNPFAKMVAGAFDIPSDLQMDMESFNLDRRLSPEGRQEKGRDHLRKAIRALRDLKKPIEEYHAKTETMRATAKLPTYDKTDFVAAMNRRELRDRSCQMTFGQRVMHMTGDTRSADFLDAVFEQPAWVSGIDVHNPNELQIYEEAKQSRLQDIHGPLLSTIAAREAVESEALMVANVVLGDLAADSRLDPREFEAEVKHVESGTGSVWLKRSTDASGHEVIYELVPEGGGFRGQIASPDALQNGHFFASHEEYLAARAA
jgi:hypothetical protein